MLNYVPDLFQAFNSLVGSFSGNLYFQFSTGLPWAKTFLMPLAYGKKSTKISAKQTSS